MGLTSSNKKNIVNVNTCNLASNRQELLSEVCSCCHARQERFRYFRRVEEEKGEYRYYFEGRLCTGCGAVVEYLPPIEVERRDYYLFDTY